ncbi:MAG: DUF4157 domain-containing protein [Anaerolineales bacterium]|nr:DUF4157 domain-containing protein [Anaerolineales bacterium]
MQMQPYSRIFETQPPPGAPRPAHLLQRKCVCGGTPGHSGECEECRKKRQGTVQRAAADLRPINMAPVIVHDVLRFPGQSLDAQTRAFMEPRFGHDFSQVRVHTDARAAESARAVNALAYTVGRDVVFGAGQYAPATPQGQRLLAHELTHVAQQRGVAFQPGSALRVGAPDDLFEHQAEASAHSIGSANPLAGWAQTANTLQRAVEEAIPQTGSGTKDSEDLCAGWLSDRESTTKRAAELYVRTELAGDRGVVERIECDLFLPTGEFACTAHFSDGTPIRVLVKKTEIIVSVAPINTMNPPPDRPLCWYDYKCVGPERDLVLTKRKCQSSKPAGSVPSGNGGRGPNP